MAVPNTFATATSAIPLANLDANFAYYDGAFSISGTATTFAGSVTLTSGTAYGVAYLNGSKVLTTGSALTFDGTNLAIAGTGQLRFDTSGAAGANFIQTVNSYDMRLYCGRGTTSYIDVGTTGQIFGIGGSEQMRLTSTGLGIGTSSPLSALHVTGAAFGATTTARIESTATNNSGSPSIIFLRSSSAVMTSQGIGNIYFTRLLTDASSNTAASIVVTGNNSSSAPTCTINYDAITNHVWKINSTESMRLDSSGNLGVGTSSPGAKLQVAGTAKIGEGVASNTSKLMVNTVSGVAAGIQFFQDSIESWIIQNIASSTALTFSNSGTERVRIDGSGNLLVGTTSVTNNPTTGVQLVNGGGSTIGGVFVGHASGVATGNYYATFNYAAGLIGSITQSGTTAVLFNVTSDQRLKENIQDADSASTLIDSLQVRQFDWKTDNTHQRYGFIAQELVTVAPEAVHQPVNEEEMMAVDYSKLVPMLVKEIQSLRKRLADAGIA